MKSAFSRSPEKGHFTYELPSDRIAQRPVRPYDAAKLLVIDRAQRRLTDSVFSELATFLKRGDLLILNNSKVLAARLFGRLSRTGSEVEILLLEELALGRWLVMGRPLKRLVLGERILFSEDLSAQVCERDLYDRVVIEFEAASPDLAASLEQHAVMPIPPYIRDGRADRQDVSDYQCHFAHYPGSVAAPTASLHFTQELLRGLGRSGIDIEFVTLHVGRDSFRAALDEDGNVRAPLGERYVYRSKLLGRIETSRKSGGKVVAVGTTVVRALESMSRISAAVDGAQYRTELFISDPFEFKMVDCLITNFHQPGSSHLMLVDALLGRLLLEDSYRHAIEGDYRFLSYGDGMLII